MMTLDQAQALLRAPQRACRNVHIETDRLAGMVWTLVEVDRASGLCSVETPKTKRLRRQVPIKLLYPTRRAAEHLRTVGIDDEVIA